MKTPNSPTWRKVRLKEVCEYITVGHVGPMATEYVEAGIPFLRSQNILPFRVEDSDLKFITPEFHQKLKKSALRPGDVAIVRTGYPGTAAVIPKKFSALNCADLVIVRPSPNLNPWFLTCILNSAWGRGAVAGNLVGVAQQHFNVSAAKEMEVLMPDIIVQDHIASILSAYDDLIENNTRRIAILEEMARRIYEEWFVHFRFPGHEQVRMVESELGLIPEGWAVWALYDVADLTYGCPLKAALFNTKGCGRGLIRIRDIKSDSTNTYTEEQVADKYLVKTGDILIGMDGEFHMGKWAGVDCWLNQRVVRLRPHHGFSRYFLYLATYQPIRHLEATIVGTTVAHLSAQDLKAMRLIVADENSMKLIGEVLDPVMNLEIALKKKNANLRTTRDLLLPKLISGELEVSHLPEPEAMAA